VNKKGLLVNILSPAFFSYVEDCETYDEALVTLKRVYVKGKNDVLQDIFMRLKNDVLQKALNNSFKP